MLLFVSLVLVTLAVHVFISAARLRGGLPPAKLGWMSEQWLAEYRASHAS
jgi:hypothetical protein